MTVNGKLHAELLAALDLTGTNLRNHVGTGHALLRKADVNGYGKTGESEH